MLRYFVLHDRFLTRSIILCSCYLISSTDAKLRRSCDFRTLHFAWLQRLGKWREPAEGRTFDNEIGRVSASKA